MDMTTHTLITIAWELHEQGLPKTHIAQRLGKHRETIILWIQGIEHYGLLGFLERYDHAKKVPRVHRQVDPILKRWIWEIREREYDCCGQKIAYFLEEEHRVSLSVPKIYEILKEKLIIKNRWNKNVVRGPVPTASHPQEVIQMDPIDFGDLFAFTAVEISSKEADILITPALTGSFEYQFLKQCMERRLHTHVSLIQTDGGPEFKEEFQDHVRDYCDLHRISRPYRKNEQSYIESFNRTVWKECLGWIKYHHDQLPICTTMVESFLDRYHYHRPHMGNNMQPPLSRKETDCRISTEN